MSEDNAVRLPLPAFGNVFQLAWVTNDIERSMEQFKRIYGIESFFLMDQSFPATLRGESGTMKLRFALANVDDVQLELIEGGDVPFGSFYSEYLPEGSTSNVFHHVCVRVSGSVDDWNAYVAGLGPDRPVVLEGDLGDQCHFIYTDERATIGIYVEHVWFSPELDAQMKALVPTFHTR